MRAERPRLTLRPGLIHYPGWFVRSQQQTLVDTLRDLVRAAPLFTPRMPRTGKPFSVRMSNCGPLGWVADEAGYRYQPHHPESRAPWPAMPSALIDLWSTVADYPHPPEACLINLYERGARMGLHQDRDEQDFVAPVVSVSLGASALFRFGGEVRGGATQSVRLESGDVVVIGGPSRLCFHGIDRIYPGTSTLLDDDRRINLTLRRVTQPLS